MDKVPVGSPLFAFLIRAGEGQSPQVSVPKLLTGMQAALMSADVICECAALYAVPCLVGA